jgi:RimJ/RimL family protein N-acetyltransferase
MSTVVHASAPPLTGRRVRLRAVVPDDHEYLYRLANHPDVQENWRYRGPSPSPWQFAQDLWEGTLTHFVAERKVNGQRFGYVQAFDASPRNGWVHAALMLDPMLARSAWAFESVPLFVNYVFTMWNFDRIYAAAPEPVFERCRSGDSTWFQVEGRLRDHEVIDDQYRDIVLMTVTRAAWEKFGPALVAKLTAPIGQP